MDLKTLVLLLVISVTKVNLMAINGSKVNLYDPCGLNILHFYKLSDYNSWQAKINLVSYASAESVSLNIFFKTAVTIQLEKSSPKGPWSHFVVHLPGPVPKMFTFNVFVNDRQSTTPLVKEYSINGKVICNEDIRNNIEEFDDSHKENTIDQPYLCGRRSFNNSEALAVVGEANEGDWPWHVAIFAYNMYKCGGNIISRTAVLSAGHCVYENGLMYDARSVYVSAGGANFTNKEYLIDMIGKGILKIVQAKSIIPHPSFTLEKSSSDLAIIIIDPLVFSNFIRPICIFGPLYEDKLSLIGKNGIVVGFGVTETDNLSPIERTSITTIQPDSKCMQYSPKVYGELLNEFTFCAGLSLTTATLQGINPREGDSGAGLVLPVPQADNTVSWFLRGILSKCVRRHRSDAHCDPNFPVIYTDVSPHYSWIEHHRHRNYVH